MADTAIRKLPNKQREQKHGVIRPMTTMEDWSMKAQEAYSSKSALKRLDQLPDLQGFGAMTRGLRGIRVFRGGAGEVTNTTQNAWTKRQDNLVKELLDKYNKAGNKIPDEEWIKLDKAVGKPPKAQPPYEYYSKEMAGYGAGGNLYGEGIYFSEHPRIAQAYARRAARDAAHSKRYRPPYEQTEGEIRLPKELIRSHNIPPQANILDVHRTLSRSEAMDFIDDVLMKHFEASKKKSVSYTPSAYKERIKRIEATYDNLERWASDPNDATTDALLTVQDVLHSIFDTVGRPKNYDRLMPHLGYDGISFKAGQIQGLPKGVPEGTKNFVIYNYDIMNKPKGLVPSPKDVIKRPLKELFKAEEKIKPVQRGDMVGPIVNNRLLPSARKSPVSPTEISQFELQQLIPPWAFNEKINLPWNKPRKAAIEKGFKKAKKEK